MHQVEIFLNYIAFSIPFPFNGLALMAVLGLLLFILSLAFRVLFNLLAMIPATRFLTLDAEEAGRMFVGLFSGLFQPRPPKPRGKVSSSYRNDPENRRLQADLLSLLKGDVATAKRLLLQQRRLNPGRTDNWYLEKVIYDLERDRH